MVFGGGGVGCCCGEKQRATGKKKKCGADQGTAGPQGTALDGRIGYWLQDGDEPPLPAAIAIPMTAAVPAAIQPIVPEERPAAAFFPALSPS